MWKLASTVEAERADQAARIKAGLDSLPAVVPEILRFEVGINSLPVNEFDVVLVSDFDDEAALQRYVAHPEHEKVAAYIRSVVSGRASVDAEY
jgi:hypothetical protein